MYELNVQTTILLSSLFQNEKDSHVINFSCSSSKQSPNADERGANFLLIRNIPIAEKNRSF